MSKKSAQKKSVPSDDVALLNERVAAKLLATTVRSAIEENFGVQIEKNVRLKSLPATSGDDTAPRRAVFATISGGHKADRTSAIRVLTMLQEDMQNEKMSVLLDVTRKPKEFSKKQKYTPDDTAFDEIETNIQLIQDVLNRESVHSKSNMSDDDKRQKRTDDSDAKSARKVLSKIKEKLKAKNTKMTVETITGILTPFLEQTRIYETDRVTRARAAMEAEILRLDNARREFDDQQADAHQNAKRQFDADERAEIENELFDVLDKMDDSQKHILLGRAYKMIDDISVDGVNVAAAIMRIKNEHAPKHDTNAGTAQYDDLVTSNIRPMNDLQAEQIRLMREKDLVLATGSAGTGKTLLAVAYALERLKSERKKIYIFRPMVELGAKESMGYLPGDEKSKIGPYMRPIFKNMLKCANYNEIKKYLGLTRKPEDVNPLMDMLLPANDVNLLSMAYLRGDTLEDCTIICDEAQDMTSLQIEALNSRAGKGAKIIYCGDPVQTDLNLKDRRGQWLEEKDMPGLPVLQYMAKQKGNEWIGLVEYPLENVVRSELAKKSTALFKEVRQNANDIYGTVFKGFGKNAADMLPLHANGNGHKHAHPAPSTN